MNLTLRTVQLVERLKELVPPWGLEYVHAAVAGDPDAAGRLVV
jgi:hypothetical protein